MSSCQSFRAFLPHEFYCTVRGFVTPFTVTRQLRHKPIAAPLRDGFT